MLTWMCRPTSVIGVRRTWRGLVSMSANDPQRTFQRKNTYFHESRDCQCHDHEGNQRAEAHAPHHAAVHHIWHHSEPWYCGARHCRGHSASPSRDFAASDISGGRASAPSGGVGGTNYLETRWSLSGSARLCSRHFRFRSAPVVGLSPRSGLPISRLQIVSRRPLLNYASKCVGQPAPLSAEWPRRNLSPSGSRRSVSGTIPDLRRANRLLLAVLRISPSQLHDSDR